MIGRMLTRLPSPLLRSTALLRRFVRAKAGIAAVEFAFIMPMMLVLYFGLAVLGQGLEVGRKVQLASRTLADLTAQQLPSSATGTTGTGNCAGTTATPCVSNADLADFYAGAQLVMTPFDTSAATMTAVLSEVVFDNVSGSNSACCRARVVWSAAWGTGQSPRTCTVLNSSANGTNGAGVMPRGNYPGGLGDATTDTAYVASGNTTDYYLIVADVTYKFKPGYDFKLFNWGSNANSGNGYTITQTTYMTPRNGANTSIAWTPVTGITNTPCTPNTP